MTVAASTLESLPNLGPASAAWLRDAGIPDPAALAAVGAVEAFRRVRGRGHRPSRNLLFALAGAIEGIDWRCVDRGSLLLALEARPSDRPLLG